MVFYGLIIYIKEFMKVFKANEVMKPRPINLKITTIKQV